ncbi:phosphatase PAP2 family protein [Luteimonas sp. BDR2-5]|uniref:acid phosphatase n=1 Tax=Proluteimonas luteida TaxID=2878685 RepID=UPI001E3C8651|nr:phosphatase PAP2 family protein [Luteimonas sp. BDR2-5]MCD9027850.1 phosphatase PAP2 family protein [Luteimonas sp. BDR2-5]
MSLRAWSALLAAALGLAACGSAPPLAEAAPEGPAHELRGGRAKGYLAPVPAFDSAALLPAPPAPGSAGQALDDAVSARALALHGTARWRQATVDAALGFPQAAGLFACALGVRIDATETPALATLLHRSLADASAAGSAAKRQWQRPRPFMVNAAPTCAPGDEPGLRGNGSYPSGHTAIGWTWALLLAELAPDRGDALLQRGRSYGESRLVCNVHWYSDIQQGQLVGAATVARLHADPRFRADFDAAAREIADQRARGATPAGCATEADALRVSPLDDVDAGH